MNSRVYLLLGAPAPNKMMNTTIRRWYASGRCGGRMGWGHWYICEPYLAIAHGHPKRYNFLPFLWKWIHPLQNPNNNQPSTAGIRLGAGDGIGEGGRGHLLLSLFPVS